MPLEPSQLMDEVALGQGNSPGYQAHSSQLVFSSSASGWKEQIKINK